VESSHRKRLPWWSCALSWELGLSQPLVGYLCHCWCASVSVEPLLSALHGLWKTTYCSSRDPVHCPDLSVQEVTYTVATTTWLGDFWKQYSLTPYNVFGGGLAETGLTWL
jgi:hypothetical protein